MRVVERAREHADRLEPQRVHDRVQLPEAEVPGEEEHALALRVREPRALLAVELDARQHRLGRQRAELQQLEQQPAEVRERARARSRAARAPDRARKRGREVALGDPPMRAVERVERQAEQRARRRARAAPASRRTTARPAPATMRGTRGGVSSARRCARGSGRGSVARRLHARQEPVAERVGRLDADDERHGRDRQVAEVAAPRSRTASFSVVSTIAAADGARRGRDARDVARA